MDQSGCSKLCKPVKELGSMVSSLSYCGGFCSYIIFLVEIKPAVHHCLVESKFFRYFCSENVSSCPTYVHICSSLAA